MTLEEVQVILDPMVAVVSVYIDVPGDRIGSSRQCLRLLVRGGLFGVVTFRVGRSQCFKHRVVGSGIGGHSKLRGGICGH
jgi:hypothetical protein